MKNRLSRITNRLLIKSFLLLVFVGFLSPSIHAQFYSGSQMDFGKNRIQYNLPRQWQWYKFEKYTVYFYMGGKELATHTSLTAKKYIDKIEHLLDYNVDEKIQFVIYNKQSDYKQSNIGLEYEEAYNVGGVTKVVQSKVFLYFNGDYIDFDRQMKAGIAQVLINQMMFSGNVRDVIKNSALLNFPSWYIQGLVSYIANGWNTEVDSRVRDGILSGKYGKFNGLEGNDALFAGYSIWNYIAEIYGESVISNILYMTKITRNVESAFLFVIGVSMRNLTSEWMQYYLERYSTDHDSTSVPKKSLLKKIKITRTYQHLKISDDGKNAIYTTNESGQYKVWLYDLKKQKAKRIMKHEQKLDRPVDYSFPLIAWHPNNDVVAIITERKGEMLLSYYTLSTRKIEVLKIFNFEKITDFSYSNDGKQFVISAVKNGQSDIYVYTPSSGNSIQITKDIYDDANPKFISNSTKIIFSSNRPTDTIRFMNGYPTNLKESLKPMEKKDLFIYDFIANNNLLRRVTSTPQINETYPSEFDTNYICFLSDENGIFNRYLGILDSSLAFVDTSEHYRYFTRTFPITNYSRNILEQDINLKAKKISEIVFNERKSRMFISDITDPSSIPKLPPLANTTYKSMLIKQQKKNN